VSYDYSDSLVLDLIQRTHVPVELVDDKTPPTLTLVCELCIKSWPCPTVLDLRTYVARRDSISPTAPSFTPSLPPGLDREGRRISG